ncbi:MAG: hypothetical protein R3D55_27730 [Chloroflexota bacterium]
MSQSSPSPSQKDKEPGRWHTVRNLPRNIWVLTLASFFTDVSSDMLMHLLPFFLANVLGIRTVTIGLIEGLAETTSSLVKLASGRWSDRLGRYKGLTVAGYALSTVAKPFFCPGWKLANGSHGAICGTDWQRGAHRAA